jgi:hypothetical protein
VTAQTIVPFITELFHPDHGIVDFDVVLISPGNPSAAIQSLIIHPAYKGRIVSGNINSVAFFDFTVKASLYNVQCNL